MHVSPAVGVHWWGIVQTSGVDPAVIWTGILTQVLWDTPQKPINKHMPRITDIWGWHWPTCITKIKFQCFKSHSLVQTKPGAGCSLANTLCISNVSGGFDAFRWLSQCAITWYSLLQHVSPPWAENPSFANGPYIIYELQIDTLWADQS